MMFSLSCAAKTDFIDLFIFFFKNRTLCLCPSPPEIFLNLTSPLNGPHLMASTIEMQDNKQLRQGKKKLSDFRERQI